MMLALHLSRLTTRACLACQRTQHLCPRCILFRSSLLHSTRYFLSLQDLHFYHTTPATLCNSNLRTRRNKQLLSFRSNVVKLKMTVQSRRLVLFFVLKTYEGRRPIQLASVNVRTGSLVCLGFVGFGIGGLLFYKLYTRLFVRDVEVVRSLGAGELYEPDDIEYNLNDRDNRTSEGVNSDYSFEMGNQLVNEPRQPEGYIDNNDFVSGLELRERPAGSNMETHFTNPRYVKPRLRMPRSHQTSVSPGYEYTEGAPLLSSTEQDAESAHVSFSPESLNERNQRFLESSDDWSEFLQAGQSTCTSRPISSSEDKPDYIVDDRTESMFNRVLEIKAKHESASSWVCHVSPKHGLKIDVQPPSSSSQPPTQLLATPSDPMSFSPHEELDSDLDDDLGLSKRKSSFARRHSSSPVKKTSSSRRTSDSGSNTDDFQVDFITIPDRSEMDDSGVDFFLDGDCDNILSDALKKVRSLYEDLSDLGLGLSRLDTQHDRFTEALNLHSKGLQDASQLLEVIRQTEEASPLMSHSSSFDLDFFRQSSLCEESYDDILQHKITELFDKAELGDLIKTDDSKSCHPTFSYNIGVLQPIQSYADKEWRGGTPRAELMRLGYAKCLEYGTFLRCVRGDNFCALRATLFQVFMHNLTLPHTCEFWLENLAAAFSSAPWLHQWSFANRLSEHLANQKLRSWSPQSECAAAACDSVYTRLAACIKTLFSKSSCLRAIVGDLHREWETFFTFNAHSSEDLELLEAVKALMMIRALELPNMPSDQQPLYAMMLYARDTSWDPKSFFFRHLNHVGDSGGLEQVEMMLLADVLQVNIEVLRPGSYGQEDFRVIFSADSGQDQPIVSLISEDDRHYNVLIKS